MEDVADSSPPSDLLSSIRNQIEYYFSDGNLAADQFLRNLIQRDKEGFVPIKTIANFNRMKSLTTDAQEIISALKSSPDLELSSDETRVRRKSPMPEFNNTTSHRRTLVVENLPDSASNDWLRGVFGKYGKVIRVRIYQPGSADIWPRWLKNSNFSHETATNFGLVEFATEEESSRAREGVHGAAQGSEAAGLRASWVQVKKSSVQQQGTNQQNRPQPAEKRPKQRANGNNDLLVQQGGSDQGNGASISAPMMPVPPDMDHPPGFQAYSQPQPVPVGRNQGGNNQGGNNAHQRGNNRGGNQNYGGQGGMNGPGNFGHGGPNTHNHRASRDPTGMPGMAAIPAAPPGTFIAPPPGTFGSPAGMMYPQAMVHPVASGSGPFQPYPPPAMGLRMAPVPVPAVMPLTGGSGTTGTPRQLSRPKSTPRGVNNMNANGNMQRPGSTGRGSPAVADPAHQQQLHRPGGQQEGHVGGRQQQLQQQQQQQRAHQHSPLEPQHQQPQPRKGNNRVLVVPGPNERQPHAGPHPQPHPHLSQPHLQGNRAHPSPNRPNNNQPNHHNHNTPNNPHASIQQRRRSATAANGSVHADAAALAGGVNGREEVAGEVAAGAGAAEEGSGSGSQVGTPEPPQKQKKQKHKKGKGKGAGNASEGEDGEEGTPASSGKGSHQKRGNQHKHDKQHHGAGDAQGDGAEDEEGKEWGKRRPRKDYASWAAATQDFRALAVAKSAATKGAAVTTAAGLCPEPQPKEGGLRVPRMPDGTKGFTMGRGKPLPKPGAPTATTSPGAFVPSGANGEAVASDTDGEAAVAGAAEGAVAVHGEASVAESAGRATDSTAGPTNAGPVILAGKAGEEPGASGKGDESAAVANVDESAAVAKGDESAAVGKGDDSAVVANVDESAAGAKGEESAAVAKGEGSAAVAIVDESAAVAIVDESAAVAKGDESAVVARVDESAAVAKGDESAVVANVDESAAVAKGDKSDVVANLDESAAVANDTVSGAITKADASGTVAKVAESEEAVVVSVGPDAAVSAGADQAGDSSEATTLPLDLTHNKLDAFHERPDSSDAQGVSADVMAEAKSDLKAESADLKVESADVLASLANVPAESVIAQAESAVVKPEEVDVKTADTSQAESSGAVSLGAVAAAPAPEVAPAVQGSRSEPVTEHAAVEKGEAAVKPSAEDAIAGDAATMP